MPAPRLPTACPRPARTTAPAAPGASAPRDRAGAGSFARGAPPHRRGQAHGGRRACRRGRRRARLTRSPRTPPSGSSRSARDARGRPAAGASPRASSSCWATARPSCASRPPDPSDDDVYISAAQVRRCELVSGDRVTGPVRMPRRSERYPSLVRIDTINGALGRRGVRRDALRRSARAVSERAACPGLSGRDAAGDRVAHAARPRFAGGARRSGARRQDRDAAPAARRRRGARGPAGHARARRLPSGGDRRLAGGPGAACGRAQLRRVGGLSGPGHRARAGGGKAGRLARRATR